MFTLAPLTSGYITHLFSRRYEQLTEHGKWKELKNKHFKIMYYMSIHPFIFFRFVLHVWSTCYYVTYSQFDLALGKSERFGKILVGSGVKQPLWFVSTFFCQILMLWSLSHWLISLMMIKLRSRLEKPKQPWNKHQLDRYPLLWMKHQTDVQKGTHVWCQNFFFNKQQKQSCLQAPDISINAVFIRIH